MKKIFFAYPSFPPDIGITIESATKDIENLTSWRALETYGHFIAEEVTSQINESDLIVADISCLNFNVTYEIGFAIGKKKRVLLTKNISIKENKPSIREVGIFDTLGFEKYENSKGLLQLIHSANSQQPLKTDYPINIKAPVYYLETKYKTDWANKIVSRIKKARYFFRSFDPNETARLSANDAIIQVAQSHGVVVPLLSSSSEGYEVHNMRAAFIAGLADGMEKALCLIQTGDDPVPLDYRDFVKAIYHPNDINDCIAEFAGQVAESFQKGEEQEKKSETSFLHSLDLGASSAENEMKTLDDYYLRTDQYLKSLRGEAHLCIGRKGSGKSAIFLQIRDIERDRNRSQNIILDLKPEGYKLVKFKELILNFFEEGTLQHTIMAFWEYVLLLEICHKLILKDKKRHLNDHDLFEPYKKLSELYYSKDYNAEGDFSERLNELMDKIHNEYKSKYGDGKKKTLSTKQVTELLYQHDVKSLREQVTDYMRHKELLWLLFDNIDKGWPTSGLVHEDLVIIRALIDATRKIERHFNKFDVDVKSMVFLRNDVYELLVKNTSDRGKEASVMLDWSDPDLLREILRLRIVSNNLQKDIQFQNIWLKICISHYNGEESSQYLIERSLMRPRFLLNLVNQCKSFAINLNHEKIESDDIEKGLSAFSSDVLTDIGYEINDIAPGNEEILYSFIGSSPKISHKEAHFLLEDFGLDPDLINKVIDLLLWYGFLGLYLSDDEIKYIYDFNYKIKIMKGVIKKQKQIINYNINPAFWPALMIEKQGDLTLLNICYNISKLN